MDIWFERITFLSLVSVINNILFNHKLVNVIINHFIRLFLLLLLLLHVGAIVAHMGCGWTWIDDFIFGWFPFFRKYAILSECSCFRSSVEYFPDFRVVFAQTCYSWLHSGHSVQEVCPCRTVVDPSPARHPSCAVLRFILATISKQFLSRAEMSPVDAYVKLCSVFLLLRWYFIYFVLMSSRPNAILRSTRSRSRYSCHNIDVVFIDCTIILPDNLSFLISYFSCFCLLSLSIVDIHCCYLTITCNVRLASLVYSPYNRLHWHIMCADNLMVIL